jgi:hypothetical protein
MRAAAESGLLEHPGPHPLESFTRCSFLRSYPEHASQEKIRRQEIKALNQEEGQQVVGQEEEQQVVVPLGPSP